MITNFKEFESKKFPGYYPHQDVDPMRHLADFFNFYKKPIYFDGRPGIIFKPCVEFMWKQTHNYIKELYEDEYGIIHLIGYIDSLYSDGPEKDREAGNFIAEWLEKFMEQLSKREEFSLFFEAEKFNI